MRPLLVIAIGLILGGCANYTTPVVPPRPMTPAERNFQSVWQASLDVLRDYQFQIDRTDRRAGLIVSEPTVGQQWFECWRDDAATGRDLAEGSLQTIYRTATVRVAPTAPGAGSYDVKVEVATARSQRTQPQVTSTAELYRMVVLPGTERKSSDLMLEAPLPDEDQLTQLGIDAKLSAEMTAKIVQRVGLQLPAGAPAPATGPATGPAPLPQGE